MPATGCFYGFAMMVPPCSCEPAAMTSCWANSGFTACFVPADGDLSAAAGRARRSRHRRAACRSAIADRRGGVQARSPGIHRRQPACRTTPAAHAGDHATAGGPAVEPAGGTVREHRQTRHPGEWYAICVTFDTDAIHVSASDTIASDDTRLGLGSGLDRYRTIIETRGGTFQTRAGQAHWQLEAVIPIDGDR